MNTIRRIILAGALAPMVLVAPAHADEQPTPDPSSPCASQEATIKVLEGEVDYWRNQVDVVRDLGWQRESVALGRAHEWEAKALNYAERLGQRTQQRDRFLVQSQRYRYQRDRLRLRVERLRQLLAASR